MVLSHGAFGFNNYSCELVGEAVAHAAGGTAPYAPRPWAVARGASWGGPEGRALATASAVAKLGRLSLIPDIYVLTRRKGADI